jgi:hypothetical protein
VPRWRYVGRTTPDPLGWLRYIGLLTAPIGIAAFVVGAREANQHPHGWLWWTALAVLFLWSVSELYLGIKIRRRLRRSSIEPDSI